MNVLVTGGAGYSHTCLEQGYGMVVIDDLCNSKSLERVRELTGKNITGGVRDVWK